MISIKRFLHQDGEDPGLWQVVSLLLERIGSGAVLADPSEFEAFGANIERLRASITGPVSAESLLLNAESALQALADYNQKVSTFIDQQGSDVRNIVAVLTDTLVSLSGGNTRCARSFQEIGDSVGSAPGVLDLDGLQLRLRECLQESHKETLQQKAETASVMTALLQQVEQSREGQSPQNVLDPATGLPQRESAEMAMLKSLKAGTRNYVATMVVSRMHSINARFGVQVGDRVLRTFRENIEKQLEPGDQMFRWVGPAIVVLLDREESLEFVRTQLKRILDAKFEETFELTSRSVLIPISTTWSAFKLVSPVALAVKQIQAFVASNGYRDFV